MTQEEILQLEQELQNEQNKEIELKSQLSELHNQIQQQQDSNPYYQKYQELQTNNADFSPFLDSNNLLYNIPIPEEIQTETQKKLDQEKSIQDYQKRKNELIALLNGPTGLEKVLGDEIEKDKIIQHYYDAVNNLQEH